MFVSQIFTAPGTFTAGIEGPACDRGGNLYAVNYARQHIIGSRRRGYAASLSSCRTKVWVTAFASTEQVKC